jgi:hypothetical protein
MLIINTRPPRQASGLSGRLFYGLVEHFRLLLRHRQT